MGTFKVYRQHDQMDCGPTCLRMIAKHHGRNYTLQTLRKKAVSIGRGYRFWGSARRPKRFFKAVITE